MLSVRAGLLDAITVVSVTRSKQMFVAFPYSPWLPLDVYALEEVQVGVVDYYRDAPKLHLDVCSSTRNPRIGTEVGSGFDCACRLALGHFKFACRARVGYKIGKIRNFPHETRARKEVYVQQHKFVKIEFLFY